MKYNFEVERLSPQQKLVKKVISFGWEVDYAADMVNGLADNFRASQGGFKTMWRPTMEAVLQDVEKIVNARKDPANQRVPF